MVLPFGSGPFLASFRPRHVREREAPPIARERVTEIVYVSFDLYHRATISSTPPPPSLPLSRFALSLFFFLLSLLISPGSLSGLILPFGDRYRARARARRYRFDTQLFASFFEDARGPYSRCLDFDISAIYCGAT